MGWTAWARRTVCAPGSERPKCLTLPAAISVLHRAGDVLDRHVRVDAVLVEEVDDLDAQPLQRGVTRLADVLGTAVHAGRLPVHDVEAELGGDHHPVAERLEGIAHDLLVGVGAVDLGRIEEGDAALHRRADERDAVLLPQRMAVAEVEAHAAEADGRDFEAGFAKYALFHCGFSCTAGAFGRRVVKRVSWTPLIN